METGQEIFRALGMSLIHSIWQGGIIAALVLFALLITGKTSAKARYWIQFTGLLLLLGSFVSTFILIFRDNPVMLTIQQAARDADLQRIYETAVPASGGLVQQVLSFLEPYSIYLAFGWLFGFLVMAIRMTGGAVFSRMLIRRNLALPDKQLDDLFQCIRNTMGLSAVVNLRISYSMISPLVTGIITPMVVIPAAAVTGLSPEQLRSVIVHELAHIRRYDHVLILLQSLAQLVLFFHPLTWFLIQGIDRERENCCDDLVIRKNNNPLNYIKALAMIQEMNLTGSPANSLTGKSNQLLNRISRLIKPEAKHSATFRVTVVLLFALTIGISTMAFIITEQPDVKAKATSQIRIESVENATKLKGIASTYVGDDKDGDKKKKMVIVFDNDTIAEMTVNGKKLSKEEMKEYADDIRKVQRELENSQDELKLAHQELANAHREMENAQRELEWMNRNNEFHFEFDNEALKFHELNELHRMNPDEFQKLQELNLDLNKLNEQINNELNIHNFHFEELNQQFQNREFHEKMMEAQEETRQAFREAFEKSLEYRNSGEFREQLKKAQEEAMKAFGEAKEKNREFFESDKFREQMKKAAEDARKAFEELKESGADQFFNYEFNLENPFELYGPGDDFRLQEPPSPRPEIEEDVEVPEAPEPPEVEEQIEVPEPPEIDEVPEVEEAPEAEVPEEPENMEIDERPEANPKSEELNNTLQELEKE